MTPKPFTVTALAERWECSPDFVYDQIRAGRLQATRLGGKLLRVSVGKSSDGKTVAEVRKRTVQAWPA